MKLGLLVMVAVAVVLPSFSESRIVSKCELRDKLLTMIKLSKKLEERTLATVICEVDRRSHLNTSLVTVFGNRIPATPKPTVITAPSATGVNQMTTAATIQPTGVSQKTTAATIQPTSTNSTTTQLTNTTTTATTSTSMTTATSPATTKSTINSVNTTLVSNSTSGGKRRKRKADSSSEEVSREEDAGHNMNPWSLGLYGLFQLSDKDFCDSGYHKSRNECHTSCTAFTDDDITDDIACVINTGYWRQILERASDSCRRTSNFFKECN